jgi:hypothetical protein
MTMSSVVKLMVKYVSSVGGPIICSFLLRKRTVLYRYLRFSSVLTVHHLAAHAPFTRQPMVLPSN